MKVAFVFLALLALSYCSKVLKNEIVLWEKCETIPVLGESCIEIYADSEKTALGIKVTAHNMTIIDQELEAEVCVTDEVLLKLIEMIPQLQPYKKIIDYLIIAKKRIPGEVLSICLDIENFVYEEHDVSGDVYLNAVIMCWKGKCIWKGSHDMGHFDFKI